MQDDFFDMLVQGIADMVDRDVLKKCGCETPKTENQKLLERTNFLNYPVSKRNKKEA